MEDQRTNREGGDCVGGIARMSIFDDGPLGIWDEEFKFPSSPRGCAFAFVGFVLFLIAVLILQQFLFN